MNVGKIIAESCHVTADFRDAVLWDFPNRCLASVPQPIGPHAVGSLAWPHARGAGFKQRTWPVPLLGPRWPFKIQSRYRILTVNRCRPLLHPIMQLCQTHGTWNQWWSARQLQRDVRVILGCHLDHVPAALWVAVTGCKPLLVSLRAGIGRVEKAHPGMFPGRREHRPGRFPEDGIYAHRFIHEEQHPLVVPALEALTLLCCETLRVVVRARPQFWGFHSAESF